MIFSTSADLQPGAVCKAICWAGWVQSPGRGLATCGDGGVWDTELRSGHRQYLPDSRLHFRFRLS